MMITAAKKKQYAATRNAKKRNDRNKRKLEADHALMKKMKIAPVKSDVGMSKSSVTVGTNKSIIERELMIIKDQFKAAKFCKTIQVEDETFKSNLNIIDLNAGKNLGFKPDGSYLYCNCIIKMKLLVNIIHVLFSCSL